MLKFLAGLKKPFMTALLVMVVVPHIVYGAPAKLTRPVWVMAPAPVAWTMMTPHPMPPWAN